jgi:hypothetical protein
MSANELKYGPTLMATGIETWAFTADSTSTYCCSTSAPDLKVSVGM